MVALAQEHRSRKSVQELFFAYRSNQANWLTFDVQGQRIGLSPSRIYDMETGRFISRDLASLAISLLKASSNTLGVLGLTEFERSILIGSRVGATEYIKWFVNRYRAWSSNPIGEIDPRGLWGPDSGVGEGKRRASAEPRIDPPIPPMLIEATRLEYEKKLQQELSATQQETLKSAMDAGCVGLCNWRQDPSKPPVDRYPHLDNATKCYRTKEEAQNRKCDCGSPFVFAVQSDYLQNDEDTDIGDMPGGEPGEVNKFNLLLKQGNYNFATLLPNGRWEYMTQGVRNQTTADEERLRQRVKRAAILPQRTYTIYCATCRGKE